MGRPRHWQAQYGSQAGVRASGDPSHSPVQPLAANGNRCACCAGSSPLPGSAPLSACHECHVVILSLRHHHHYPVCRCRCRCRHCRHFKFIALQFVERHAAYTQFRPMNFYACCVALANYAMHFRLIRLIADSTRTGFNLALYHD